MLCFCIAEYTVFQEMLPCIRGKRLSCKGSFPVWMESQTCEFLMFFSFSSWIVRILTFFRRILRKKFFFKRKGSVNIILRKKHRILTFSLKILRLKSELWGKNVRNQNLFIYLFIAISLAPFLFCNIEKCVYWIYKKCTKKKLWLSILSGTKYSSRFRTTEQLPANSCICLHTIETCLVFYCALFYAMLLF